jgi:hypothetical protein
MKSEIRNPKSEESPKAEDRIAFLTRCLCSVRFSVFGLLSVFGIRISDFGPEVAH